MNQLLSYKRFDVPRPSLSINVKRKNNEWWGLLWMGNEDGVDLYVKTVASDEDSLYEMLFKDTLRHFLLTEDGEFQLSSGLLKTTKSFKTLYYGNSSK